VVQAEGTASNAPAPKQRPDRVKTSGMPSFRRAKTDSDATCKARSKWFPTIFESPTVAAVNLLGMVTQPHTTMLFLKVYDHKPHWKQVYMDRAIDPAALKRY
jgi:hypothetical protein